MVAYDWHTYMFEIREEIFSCKQYRGKPRHLLLESVLVFTPYGTHKTFVFSTQVLKCGAHPSHLIIHTKTNTNTYKNTCIMTIHTCDITPHTPTTLNGIMIKQVFGLLINFAFRFC